jgi:hypothetical protein
MLFYYYYDFISLLTAYYLPNLMCQKHTRVHSTFPLEVEVSDSDSLTEWWLRESSIAVVMERMKCHRWRMLAA